MDFSFSDEQMQFRDQMRAFAEKHCPPSAVREAWTSETGFSSQRWSMLAEMGVAGLTVPERFGGLGLGQVDLVLLLEEAGRACVPEPLLETVAVGVPLLVSASASANANANADTDTNANAGGNADATSNAAALCAKWLTAVAAGEAVVALGIHPRLGASAVRGSDLLVLEHIDPNASGAEALQVHMVQAREVGLEERPMLDGITRLSSVNWEPSSQSLLACGEDAQRLLEAARDRAANAAAALLLGVSQQLIDMAAHHATQRSQFGHVIGSFQALKHLLANALVRLEFARPLVYRAAWSLDTGEDDAGVKVSMAKAHASDAATTAARSALQVHGAIGYTWEHDLHLWMKHAWALSAAWGDARSHRARVLAALVDDRRGR